MIDKKTKNMPVRKYVAYGKGSTVNAAVWRNAKQYGSGKVGHFATVSIGRRYKDRESEEWRSSSSFSLDDLRKLRLVIDRVLEDAEQPAQVDPVAREPAENSRHVRPRDEARAMDRERVEHGGGACVVC